MFSDWYIETFNEDWKQHSGWGKKAFQHGEEGSRRGVVLSLLIDYFYLWHPAQIRLLRSGLPPSSVGCLVKRIQIEYVITTTPTVLNQPNPKEYVNQIKDAVDQIFILHSSTKHSAGNAGFNFPDYVPSKSLAQKFKYESYLEQ